MPEEFPPEWEYWTPDPEIAECMGWTDPVETVVDTLNRAKVSCFNSGFRVIKTGRGRLSAGLRWIPDTKADDFPAVPGTFRCRRCGTWDDDNDGLRVVYCRTCCPKQGGNLKIPATVCVYCGVPFRPKYRKYFRYCSKACGGKHSQEREVFATGCPTCGGAVVPSTRGNGKAKKYCSKRCMRVMMQRNLRRKDRDQVDRLPHREPPEHVPGRDEGQAQAAGPAAHQTHQAVPGVPRGAGQQGRGPAAHG